MRILFHGTCAAFERFTEEGVGLGADCNSALGVHLANDPLDSADYAHHAQELGEGQGKVLIVELDEGKEYDFESSYDFFGVGDVETQDPAKTHEDYATLRQRLIQEGYHTAEVDTGEQWIIVALDPTSPRIIGEISIQQVRQMMEDIKYVWPDDSEARLDLLRQAGAVLRPDPSLARRPGLR